MASMIAEEYREQLFRSGWTTGEVSFAKPISIPASASEPLLASCGQLDARIWKTPTKSAVEPLFDADYQAWSSGELWVRFHSVQPGILRIPGGGQWELMRAGAAANLQNEVDPLGARRSWEHVLNGIQKVVGSNPAASTSKRAGLITRTTLFHFPRRQPLPHLTDQTLPQRGTEEVGRS